MFFHFLPNTKIEGAVAKLSENKEIISRKQFFYSSFSFRVGKKIEEDKILSFFYVPSIFFIIFFEKFHFDQLVE